MYLLSAVFLPAQSAAKQANAWTPEAMLQVKTLGAVQVSPTGKRVAYEVREAIMEKEKSEFITQIHVANVDGTDAFQLTAGQKGASNPEWSPDGEWIAFTSARSGKSNIWLIRVRGGEAQQLTDCKSGVGDFRWSPDGKQIAFIAPDPPTPEEEKRGKEKDDARVVDEDLKMNRLYVVAADRPPKEKQKGRKLTTGNYNVAGGGPGSSFDWSPDGKAVVFSHTRTPKADDWPSADISMVDVSSATVKPLVHSNAAESAPHYSPDGEWIAYLASDAPAHWAGSSTIHIIPAAGGTPRPLAETFDHQPGLIGWTADGKKLYCSETRGTLHRLYAVPLSGEIQEISTGEGLLMGFQLNLSRSMLGFTRESTAQPPEAFVSSVESFEPRQVSHANAHLPAAPLGRTEVVRWKSVDGLEIEGLLTYPVGYESGKRYPLLLVIHGGPTGVFLQNYIARPSPYPLAVFAARGYAVLRCNPRGSSGYGKTFRFANYDDWGGKDYQDLMTGVDHVIEMGVADRNRLGVMGWSYGGYMTSWIITQTKRFRAASVGAGVTNLMSFTGTADIPSFLPDYFHGEPWDHLDAYRAHSAMFQVKGANTPTLIEHGEKDVRVPISQGYELYNALKRQGCVVKMVVYPRTPHGPQEPKLILDLMKRNLEWFDKYVRGNG
jgi:dipeptidyl aminopeptidase/acylaminoacyl peptidase